MNIQVNAAQDIEENGEITISTEFCDGFDEIRISDTGVGIPKEKVKGIFMPFSGLHRILIRFHP